MDKIVRYGDPSKLDEFPQGTPCIIYNKDRVVLFLQVSTESAQPVWECMGDYPLDISDEYIQDIINTRIPMSSI